MTASDGYRPVGPHRVAVQVQAALIGELCALVAGERASLQQMLDRIHRSLRRSVGLGSAAVHACEHGSAGFMPVADVGVHRPEARLELPLRHAGETLGLLVLTGRRLHQIRPEVLDAIALHLAVVLRARASDRANAAIYRLFEQGADAPSVETAGETMARVTADAFGTERAGLNLVDTDGRISHTVGVGLSAELSAALHASLVGRLAQDSPVWRSTELASGPVLVDDADTVAVRAGGFVRTMELRSYIAMPLLSASGLVGMVVCGDASRYRTWSAGDRQLAQRLAVAGALIVDSARLRQLERSRLDEVTHRAFHDALTGLPNRALLLERIDGVASAGRRLALLLIDLDKFKDVNDTLGHHSGDLLLQGCAERLRRAIGPDDTAARLGGDEFAVLVAGDPDPAAVQRLAAELHRQLTVPFDLDGVAVQVGASIGIATTPGPAEAVGDLFRNADTAMYAAKRQGTGPRLYRPEP